MLNQKKKAKIKHDMQQWEEVKALKKVLEEIKKIIKKAKENYVF